MIEELLGRVLSAPDLVEGNVGAELGRNILSVMHRADLVVVLFKG